MSESEGDLAATVSDVLSVDPEEFQRRVEEDAEVIEAELREGTFDNPQGCVGLEYEFYAVTDGGRGRGWTSPGEDGESGSLARLPRRLLEYVGFEKELGLHNAEMSTSPQPLNAYGLEAQTAEVCARLEAAAGPMRAEGLWLVSDGMWTIPPQGETAARYLTDSVEDDGIRIATNMTAAARYHAMANSETPAGMVVEAPHVSLTADTVMPESLITSIQPHYQVPHARNLPTYFRYALRVAGPLLALAVNSPFFPPDLYDADADAEAILADSYHENRVPVFEGVLNAEGHEKVRFPRDIDTAEEAIDRVVGDKTMVPMPVGGGDRFDDEFAHFKHKHGTFWRWVRPVFDGATRSAANARIEFRPLPAQPTVRDTVALQATFAGLLVSLRQHEHPVRSLGWADAEANFYAAVEDGLAADLRWVRNDGAETRDKDDLYDDVFSHAVAGLESQGLTTDAAESYVAPLRGRVERGVTPAAWKRSRVRERLDDGESFESAVYGMQREYIEKQQDTLLEGTFLDWL